MNPHIDSIIENIELYKSNGDYDSALKSALSGLNSQMNDYRLYEELADIYVVQGNLDKAEEVIRYARELHPKSGTGIFLEGHIFMEKGEFEKALSILTEANSLFPNNAEIIRNIGWCHVMLGTMQKGIALLKRAKSLAPDDEYITQSLHTALILDEENNSSTL